MRATVHGREHRGGVLATTARRRRSTWPSSNLAVWRRFSKRPRGNRSTRPWPCRASGSEPRAAVPLEAVPPRRSCRRLLRQTVMRPRLRARLHGVPLAMLQLAVAAGPIQASLPATELGAAVVPPEPLPPAALAAATVALSRHGACIRRFDVLTVVDFDRPWTRPWLWVGAWPSGVVLFQTSVSHGSRSGGDFASVFGNVPGSFLSTTTFHSIRRIRMQIKEERGPEQWAG